MKKCSEVGGSKVSRGALLLPSEIAIGRSGWVALGVRSWLSQLQSKRWVVMGTGEQDLGHLFAAVASLSTE